MAEEGPEIRHVIGEQLSGEERLRFERERGVFVIEGEDLIKEIQLAKPEDLPVAIDTALAFREGLVFGVEGYDLDKPETRLYLQNLFTSAESATERPNAYYLNSAMKEKIRTRVRGVKRVTKKERRDLKEEEKEEIKKLISLENHTEARGLIDVAFSQRMKSCEEAGLGANLLARAPDYGLSIKPDKGHWMAALQGDFGLGVDKVLRKIVEMADVQKLPEELRKSNKNRNGIEFNIYAEGFKNDRIFGGWLSELLNEAGGRMDAVWFAWRLALTWEIPATLGVGIVTDKETGEKGVKIADPPIGNDLFTWTAHLEKKRQLEWGCDADGNRKRISKYLTHTGYPISLGKICPEGKKQLCKSYLHEAIVKLERGTTSLWEIWWNRSIPLGKLPWALTELQPSGLDTEELGTGSFALWLLRRARASKVLEDIRSRPTLKDLSNPDFFGERLRNWEKVLGEVNEEVKPEDNPRAWWVAGMLLFADPEDMKKAPIILGTNPEFNYSTYSNDQHWSYEYLGEASRRPISVWEILNHAYQCGFLRPKDIDWLVEKLKLPKRAGARAY